MTKNILSGAGGGALPLTGHEELLDGSIEVARLWIRPRGPATFFIQPERIATPEMFGMLMADCIREAAVAFGRATGWSEEEALERIWRGLEEERAKSDAPDAADSGKRID